MREKANYPMKKNKKIDLFLAFRWKAKIKFSVHIHLQQQFHLKNIALVTTHPVITIPDYISSSTPEVTQSGDPSERHRLYRVTRKNPQLGVLNKTEIPVFRFTVSGNMLFSGNLKSLLFTT